MKKRKGFTYIDVLLGICVLCLSFLSVVAVYSRSVKFTENIFNQQQLSDLSVSIVETLSSEVDNGNEITDYIFENLPEKSSVKIEKDFVYNEEFYIVTLNLQLNNSYIKKDVLIYQLEDYYDE